MNGETNKQKKADNSVEFYLLNMLPQGKLCLASRPSNLNKISPVTSRRHVWIKGSLT